MPLPLPLPPKRSNLRTRCIRVGNATVNCYLSLPPNKRDLHVRLPKRKYRPGVTFDNFDEARDVRIHTISKSFTRETAFYCKQRIKRASSSARAAAAFGRSARASTRMSPQALPYCSVVSFPSSPATAHGRPMIRSRAHPNPRRHQARHPHSYVVEFDFY
jgi:hypothetical protein